MAKQKIRIKVNGADMEADVEPRLLLVHCIRDVFGLKRAPEFDEWLAGSGIAGADFRLARDADLLPDFASRLIA